MSTTPYRKKLIEVALPLAAINEASAKEKSIRQGHPSTLHLWWARRPLAAARAVLFAQLVDDPSAWPELFPTEEEQDRERQRLFKIIEQLVPWEATNDDRIINAARQEIARSWARGTTTARGHAILQANAASDQVSEFLATEVPPIHDPFAGGGTIPLEACRLGLRTIASDLNPVAVLINKAQVEILPRFAGAAPVNPDSRARRGLEVCRGAEGVAEDVRYYGTWMRQQAKDRIGHLYPDVRLPDEHGGGSATVITYLWARTVSSPNPACHGAHIPLVSSFWLSKRAGAEAWVQPVVDPIRREISFIVRGGPPPNPDVLENGTKAGKAKDFVCLLSGAPVTREYIRAEGKAGRLGERLFAVVAETREGRVFIAPTPELEMAATKANENHVVTEARQTFLAGTLPSRAMITGGVCSAYGLATWGHLFTARQILALLTFSDLIEEARGRVEADATAAGVKPGVALSAGGIGARAYSDAVAIHLAFAFDKLLDTNSSLCTWQTLPPRLRSTFGRQGFPMTWDFAESNPFAGAAGDYQWCIETQAKVVARMPCAPVAGRAFACDAASVAVGEPVIVSTDPPYYDNIGYAELSDFFFVWLRRNLREVVPELLQTMLVPKSLELVATPHRFGGDRSAAQRFFEEGLGKAFLGVRAATNPDTPITVYYAFKQTEVEEVDEGESEKSVTAASTGWETMLSGLLGAGLQVVGTWPVRTEWATRNVSRGTNALASSIVLVCRPRPVHASTITRADFRRELRGELPDALKRLRLGNIAPVDLAQASIGPGMSIFSRHARVLEADGSAMPVRSALQLINESLDECLSAQEGDADPATRFALTWFETHGWSAGAYGDAETLAKARNVSVAGIAEDGLLHSAAGKVRLLKRSELSDLWDPRADRRPTVWEATQYLIKHLEERGEAAAATLMKLLGANAGHARDLAYRLYATCERKGWVDDARAYNGLIIAWLELEHLAATAVANGAEQTTFKLDVPPDPKKKKRART